MIQIRNFIFNSIIILDNEDSILRRFIIKNLIILVFFKAIKLIGLIFKNFNFI